MEQFEQFKELVATLNLESETTREIVQEIMPLLWWKIVWIPLVGQIFGAILAIISVVVFITVFRKVL